MKFMAMAATVAASLFLLTVGAPRASVDITLDQTLYCINDNTCGFTAPSGAYWEVQPDITVHTRSHTFDFMTVTAFGGAGGYLQDFSGQYFYDGARLTSLACVKGKSNRWTDLEASKAGTAALAKARPRERSAAPLSGAQSSS